MKFRVCRCGILGLAAAVALLCFSSLAFAAGVVSSATQASLTAAMVGGGTVTFATNMIIALESTIVVTNNTVLDATGHSVAISGGNAVQIFIVNAGTTLAITNLTLMDGFNSPSGSYNSYGGAISNGGTLEVTECTFVSNSAVSSTNYGSSGNALGGAIYNMGTLQVTATAFEDNTAAPDTLLPGYTSRGGIGAGGAIYNAGTFRGFGLYFGGNSAVGEGGTTFAGTPGFPAAPANGGALDNTGSAYLGNCIFSNNTAIGGIGVASYGQPGGTANGGAVVNGGNLVVSNSAFIVNVALGGSGSGGQSGYVGYDVAGPGGAGGSGGSANAGGVCSVLGGSAILVNDTFWSNSAVGGVGGQGGSGGAIVQGPAYNGGNGGQGGIAAGGAFYSSGGTLLIWNVTVASNSAAGGVGGAGGPGGQAIESSPSSPGSPGLPGSASGDSVANVGGSITLKNSIFVPNAASDTNILGFVADNGNNIDSIAEGALANSTSLSGVNPLLSPLGNYGGPTPTIALLPGSPAIDAGDPSDFPPTDQRGAPRPFGPAPDIGAFENTNAVTISGQITGLPLGSLITIICGHQLTSTTNGGGYSFAVDEGSFIISPTNANYVFSPAFQTLSLQSNQTGINFQAYPINGITLGRMLGNSISFVFAGTNTQNFRIETSTDLATWTPIVTNTISESGYAEMSFPIFNGSGRFFRVVSP